MEAPLHRAVYSCKEGTDIHGLIKGIAEEYSFHNHPNDPNFKGSNWLTANQTLYDFLSNIFYQNDEIGEVEEYIHDAINCRARIYSVLHPGNNSVDNWLTAQKQLAIRVYNMVHLKH